MHSHMNDRLKLPFELVDDLLQKLVSSDRRDLYEDMIRELELRTARFLDGPRPTFPVLDPAEAEGGSTKKWELLSAIIDDQEARNQLEFDGFFGSLKLLINHFESEGFPDLADRVAEVHDAWAERANLWVDVFLAWRLRLSEARAKSLPDGKKPRELKSSADVDAMFEKMLS